MELHPDDASELTGALEQQVETQAEAAKRAIREYKNAILQESVSGGVRQLEWQREVEHAVNEYMQLLKKLDELIDRSGTKSAR